MIEVRVVSRLGTRFSLNRRQKCDHRRENRDPVDEPNSSLVSPLESLRFISPDTVIYPMLLQFPDPSSKLLHPRLATSPPQEQVTANDTCGLFTMKL